MARRGTGCPAIASNGWRRLELAQDHAYALATRVMAESSQSHAAAEGIAAFLDKRRPSWDD